MSTSGAHEYRVLMSSVGSMLLSVVGLGLLTYAFGSNEDQFVFGILFFERSLYSQVMSGMFGFVLVFMSIAGPVSIHQNIRRERLITGNSNKSFESFIQNRVNARRAEVFVNVANKIKYDTLRRNQQIMTELITLDVVYTEAGSGASRQTSVQVDDIRRYYSVPSYEHRGAHTCVHLSDGRLLYVKQHVTTVALAMKTGTTE